MFCPECGKKNVDNARFCTGCGAKLADDFGLSDDGPASGRREGGPNSRLQFPEPAGSGCHGKWVGFAAAGVAAAVALAVLVAVFVVFPALNREAEMPAWESAGVKSAAESQEAAGGLEGTVGQGENDSGVQEEPTDPSTAFKAGYAETMNANRGRTWYLASENDSDGYGSRLIDHGSYYEVTNGCIYADVPYDLSIMNDKKIGDLLEINDTVYRIWDIVVTEGGEFVHFDYVSGADKGYWSLRRDLRDNFYALAGEDAETDKDLLYTGSLYFSKDCKASALDPDNGFERHPVTFKDYATLPSRTVGAEHGLSDNGQLRLWGDFEMDPSGLITSYDEYFVP